MAEIEFTQSELARRATQFDRAETRPLSPAENIENRVREKSNFRQPVQADLGCPVPLTTIPRFTFFRNCDLLSPFRVDNEGRIAIVTKRGAECGGRKGAD
jgi:hypothetical protein